MDSNVKLISMQCLLNADNDRYTFTHPCNGKMLFVEIIYKNGRYILNAVTADSVVIVRNRPVKKTAKICDICGLVEEALIG